MFGFKPKRTIAAVITTILKDETMLKCISSFDKYNVVIYLLDQGDITPEKEIIYQELEKKGHHIYRIKQDCGLSAARNWLIERVTEPYVFISDDDVELVSNPYKMLSHFNRDRTVGIVGGQLWNVGRGFEHNYNYALEIKNGNLYMYKSDHTDLVLNFFIANRDIFQEVKWDENLKMVEHVDFFLQLKQLNKWKVVFDKKLYGKHYSTHFRSDEYRKQRKKQCSAYLKMYKEKWGFKSEIRIDNVNYLDKKTQKMKKIEVGIESDFNKIITVINELKIKSFLYGGSLLSCIRDKRFQVYKNIDFGIVKNSENDISNILINKLQENNFTLVKKSKNIIIFKAPCGLEINFFIFYELPNQYYHNRMGGFCHFPKECLDNLNSKVVLKKKVPIPNQPAMFLQVLYGKDWETPNPYFKKPNHFNCWTNCLDISEEYFNEILQRKSLRKVEIVDVNFGNILDMDIYDILREINYYLDKLGKKPVLSKTTCLQVVVNHKLEGSKLELSCGKLKLHEIEFLESKGYKYNDTVSKLTKGAFTIQLEYRFNRKTKPVVLANETYSIPLPVIPYLQNLYGKNWQEKGKIE
jgi:hypothetical protein